MICLQTKNLCLSPVYRQVDKNLSIDKRRLVVAIVSIATSQSKILFSTDQDSHILAFQTSLNIGVNIRLILSQYWCEYGEVET